MSKPVPSPRPRLGAARRNVPNLRSGHLPASPDEVGFVLKQEVPPAGERAAKERLRQFMAGPVYEYGQARDFPAQDGTSHLSPHLRAGTLGIRTILAALNKARDQASPAQTEGCDVFLNELIWREFYLQVLHNFPQVTQGAFRPEYNQLQWSENREHFQAWCEGRTGYPIVDAAMRCLNATGGMHNRLRMIVAMFLTKDLLINWQWGERYFMQQLVDGDLAANNGGWQWSAGTGTDAAPYFRIFNPVSQALKFDPAGTFVRRWVPELKHFPNELVQQPWKDPLRLSGSKYPGRIVLHEEQRGKCLAMFKAVK
jgi:deoxyribodipyrimidine photo-lyase